VQSLDAIITDLPSAQGIVGTNPTLKIAAIRSPMIIMALFFAKGDPEVATVNKTLDL